MQGIYQVKNSYHLREGLDSEFLVIAENEEEARQRCLQMLAEDQDMHIASIREEITSLEKALNKQWSRDGEKDPAMAFMERVNQRNRENIQRYQRLLAEFHGYKAECLSVRKINPRLKNGCVQYEDSME